MGINGKIRILECIRQGQIGGGESHLLSLMENLDRERFDPVVLSFTDGPMVTSLRDIGIPVHVIHTEKPFDVFKWGQVKKLIEQEKIDLIHAHGTRANSNVLWPAKRLRIPVVYTIHGWSFHDDQSFFVRNLRILGEKYLTRKSDVNISVSASNRDSGKKVIRNFDSLVINNGIDLNRFNPANQFSDVRKELNIAPDKKLILFIARFTSHKQPLTLIKAFSKIAAANPDLHLLLVGQGDQEAEARAMIEQLGISDSVTMSPFRKDVPDCLAAADVYVLPSLWEGLPIGLLEAMAMGKAVIASEVDGTKEIV
ncbi:MAG TPA: glycosyltransferase, partial [Parasegetibacter sp.]